MTVKWRQPTPIDGGCRMAVTGGGMWLKIDGAVEHYNVSKRSIERWIKQNKVQTKLTDNGRRLVWCSPTTETDNNDGTNDGMDGGTCRSMSVNVGDEKDSTIEKLNHKINELQKTVELGKTKSETDQKLLDSLQKHNTTLQDLLVSSNKALDQEQQLHAITQKSLESHRLQLEESQRPKPLIARLKAVFVAN